MDWRLRMRLSWCVLCPVATWECFKRWMWTQFSAKVCKGRYTLGDKLQQPVVATRRIDKSVHVYWRISVKIFVSSREFCRSNMSQKIKSENLCASMWQQNSVEYFLQFVAVFCHVIARKLYKNGTRLLSCDHKEWYRDTNLLTRLWWNLTRSPDLTRFKSSLSQGEREGWWEGGRRGDSLSFALFLPITLGALFVHASRFASPTSDPNRRDCVTRRCDTSTIFQGKKRHTQRTKLFKSYLLCVHYLPFLPITIDHCHSVVPVCVRCRI